MRRLTLVSILLFALCGLLAAQGTKLSRAAIDSVRALRTMAGSGSVLRFEADKIEMGAMLEGDTARVLSFSFVNDGRESVRIGRVAASCGCLTVLFDTVAVEPGGRGEIKLRFSPRGRAGTVDVDAFVYLAGSASRPEARLRLLGNVIGDDEWEHLPHRMGALRLKSRKVSFGTVEAGRRRIERIACANVGVQPLNLSAAIKPSYVTLGTEPATIGPGEEGDIIITLDTDKIPQTAGCKQIKIIIEGIEGRPSQRTIEAEFNVCPQKTDDNNIKK
ncbi:MAG: DUF1573 domain-containing protein [Bacteroidaceae bacterium]|nr:DUF1573 domain-containing protein [Bacteroidaceae bacterium]